jgi:deoxyribose-phosphate aldolase
MRETVGKELGVKASGGIATLESARALIAAGANRLGTSQSCAIMRELAAEELDHGGYAYV